MKNIFYKIIISSCFIIILFDIKRAALAKHATHKPKWEEILPEIGKEFLPEGTREKIDKIFPSQNKKAEKKDGVDIYREDTHLSGKQSSPIKIFGRGKLEDFITTYKVTIKKEAIIKNSKLNKVIVGSSLEAKKTTFQTLTVHGSATLKECQVLNETTIDGELIADNSTFQSSLQILGKHVNLNNSKTADIKFSGNSSKKTLILEESEINGNIIFEGETGKVIIKKRSKIYGKIKNGRLETDGKF
jgi:cytoskeletal protein CcmA (bactofilin family)